MHTAYPYSIGYYEFEFDDRSIALGNAITERWDRSDFIWADKEDKRGSIIM